MPSRRNAIAWYTGHHSLLFSNFLHINHRNHLWPILIAYLIVRKWLSSTYIIILKLTDRGYGRLRCNRWLPRYVLLLIVALIILNVKTFLLKLLAVLHETGLHHLDLLDLLLNLELHHVLV